MAKKKEDPAVVAQRKQERVQFVQSHPLLQPEVARQRFFVQTRAAELAAKGVEVTPEKRQQLRERFQTGNVVREGFYTPGDISRIAAEQNYDSPDATSTTPAAPVVTPKTNVPTGPRYTGGQPTTRSTPKNEYVAPEKTTALGGVIPAATQFRMDSSGASGFGKTGESRLVADTPVNEPTNRTDASGNTGMGATSPRPNVEGPNVRMRMPEDTNSMSYLERRANNNETTLSEYQESNPVVRLTGSAGEAQLAQEMFVTRKSRMTPKEIAADRAQAVANRYGAGILAAEVIAGTAAAVAGAPVAGVVAAGALGVGLSSKIFGEIRQSETGLTNEQINRTALLQGGISLAAGAALGVAGVAVSKAIPKIKPAVAGIKNWADTPGEAQPIKSLVEKIKLANKKPIELPSRPAFQENRLFPGEQLALPKGDSYSSYVKPPEIEVKPITGVDRLENAAAVVARNKGEVVPPAISGQSLADSKPAVNPAFEARQAKLQADADAGVVQMSPQQRGAVTRAKNAAAKKAEADRLAAQAATPQSALSTEPVGAAATDPNIAPPTAVSPSGKVTVAEMQAQTPVKPAKKNKLDLPRSSDKGAIEMPGTEPAWITELKAKNAAIKAGEIVPTAAEGPIVRAEQKLLAEIEADEILVKNPNRNKALIRPAGDPLPGMETTGNRFDKAEQAVLNRTGFFDTEIPAPKPRSVFEAKTDVDEAFSRITPDELGRAQLENKSLGEIVLPKLEAVRAENKSLFRDRVRDYENKRYPNIDDMSGRPIPTPDANKPVNISLEDAIKQGQAKAPVADSVDQGLVEAKRLFDETGVAPKRGSDYLLNKKTGEIYKVERRANKQPGVKLTPEERAANRKITRQKENAKKRVNRATTSGKIDVATAKEVLSSKPGTVSLADAIKQGTAKEVVEPELGPFLINGNLYTAKKTLPDTVKGPLGATGRQTVRAKAALTEPVYPRGLPDNAPFDTPPYRMSPAQEKAYTKTLADQANIFETTGYPTKLETETRQQIRKLFGVEALNRIDAAAGTGINTTIKLPTAVTEPTIGVVRKPKFLPSGKIKGSTRSEQIANWTKYSNSEGFKTLSLTNPQKYAEIVEANRAIDAAMKTDIEEALGKQSAFKLQMPSQSGKAISASDDPWQKSLTSEAGPMPTEFAGGTKEVRSTDPVLGTDRAQNLPYGAEISPADPSKYVPKMPNPIPANASKEQQMAFDSALNDYFDELNGVGPESIARSRAAMNLENQTALREQAAAMPNSPLKRETIKELNTFNRTNYPNETYPGFGTRGRNSRLSEDDYLNSRTSPWQSSNPRERVIDPGDTFEKFSKSRAGKGKTEADYAVAKAEYDSKIAALEAEPRGFTGDVEPFVGRFTPEQNQSLEAWSASRQATETTPRTTVSIDELTAGSTNKARVAMEEDALERAEAIAAQVKFKAAQEAERTNYFNARTERGDFDRMREGFARQDANRAALPKPPTREEAIRTGVIRRLKTRVAEKEAADAAAAQAAAKADAEEALPLNVDQYYRERWDQSNPWVVQARQGYQARIDQSGLTNLETRYTSNRPRGLYRGPQPAARTEQSAVVPRSEVSNAAPVSPGVQLRQNATNRDEWLAANEKLKGTPDYIYERSVNEIVPPDMTEAITSIKDEAAANAAEATKEYESFDYGAFD